MRPYVICHMMPSVDGRLRTNRWGVPQSGQGEYDRFAETYKADAWLCGTTTFEEFADGHFRHRSRGPRVPQTDFVRRGEDGQGYAVALDRHGKLNWRQNSILGDALIVVLTKGVPNDYVAFLRKKEIAYIFAGSRGKLNLRQALQKLRTKFGVKKVLLEGGGATNGAFLKAGLIDEVSMLLTPVADGGVGEPALFDVEVGPRPKRAVAKLRLKSVRRAAAGILWIRYGVSRSRRSG